MDGLSPEQREMFAKLKHQFIGAPATPVEPEPPPTPPTAPRIFNGTEWYGIRPGRASDIEVRVLGALLTARHSHDVVDKFLIEAETDAPRIAKLGDEWAPLADSTVFHHTGLVLGPLESALHNLVVVAGGDGTIETVAAALASPEGGSITITPASIYAYCQALLKKKRLRLKGPPRDGGRSHSARHVSAIPMLIELLRAERRQLRHALDRHRVVVMHEVKMTQAELADQVEDMQVEQENAISNLTKRFEKEMESKEESFNTIKAIKDTAIKAKSKAQIKAKKSEATRREVRREEKAKATAKANEKVSKVREQAAEEVDEELRRKHARAKELKSKAHAEKRAEHAAREKAEELADTRLEENKELKRKIKELQGDMEELKEEINDTANGTIAEVRTDAIAKISSMPTWNLTRPDGGRGGGQLEDIYTETIFEMFGNGTPLSAIGKNVFAVLRRTVPWLKPRKVSKRTLNDKRFELRTAEETLAAIKVATSFAIRMLGFDETTKFGNPSITSNVIIEPTEGAKLEAVILRGAYCSGGGTSEKIAEAIEKKCFSRLRDLLRKLKATYVKLYPNEPWPGPEPEQLSMARLAGGGALMSDTCNTAQKAKTLLAEMIAKQMREQIGEEAWGKLSEEEQKQMARVHKLDCWQHMRNIFLKEMSKEQSKRVADELQAQLATFASWERMSTDFDQLLRASEKEFHHHCRYYHSKGRDYGHHLLIEHPKAFVVHFERAEGGRQDLDYDAAIPMYINRKYMVEYLHGLVFSGDHSNILEDFLYITYTTTQFIAMIRANAIIDLLVSRPLRCLTGLAHELDSFSPVTLLTIKDGKPLHASPIDLVEALFKKGEADGSTLLDSTLDIFKPIANMQPKFAAWQKHMYEEAFVLSPDGKEKHLMYKLAREELFNPADPSNQQTRLKTIEYAHHAHCCSCQAERPLGARW